MNKEGERVGREETESWLETERIEVQELGSKILDVLADGAENSATGRFEQGEGSNRTLNEAVFEHVDLREIERVTSEYTTKIELKTLLDLHDGLKENIEAGIYRAGDYFANLLDLRRRPIVDLETELPDNVLGKCVHGAYGKPDDVLLNVDAHNGDVEDILDTIAHEYWHSWQHQEADVATCREGNANPEDRGVLYAYNLENYIPSKDDVAGYREQLVECEARLFGDTVLDLLALATSQEQYRTARNMFLKQEKPKIYGTEVEDEVEREMQRVFGGLDVEEFLQDAGVKEAGDFFESDSAKGAAGFVRAVGNLAGLEDSIEVEFVPKLENGKRAWLDRKGRRIVISDEKAQDLSLISIAELVWRMRQYDLAKDENSEHGKMYAENLREFVTARDDERLYKEQLIVRERKEFKDILMDILDEWALEEEIDKLPPDERAEVKRKQAEVGWEPVVSQKYNVKRKRWKQELNNI